MFKADYMFECANLCNFDKKKLYPLSITKKKLGAY